MAACVAAFRPGLSFGELTRITLSVPRLQRQGPGIPSMFEDWLRRLSECVAPASRLLRRFQGAFAFQVSPL